MSPSNNEIMSDHSSTEPDTPAESYQLPLTSDIDWIDVHKVYERDDSVKETTNPKSHGHLHNSKNNIGSNSQRFSGNLKPGIIGLPGSIQSASSILGHSARRPSGIRIIPRKNGSKLTGLDNEPGSPKVSCMGKVLSEKSNHRRRKSKAKKASESAGEKNSKSEAREASVKSEHKGPGCLLRMARMFCVSKKRAMDIADESIRLEKEKDAKMKGKKSLERNVEAKEQDTPVPVPVPGIGGMKRFASGRKVDWDFQEDTGNSGEVKEGKSLENIADVNEIGSRDDEKDTPVPVLVLGLGGLKRFASGRKLDWNFEIENDEGCADEKGDARVGNSMVKSADSKEIYTFENKIGTQLHVPVLGIGMMSKFPSGRKVDWSFEVDASKGPITKEDYENKAVSVSVSGRKKDKKIGTTKESQQKKTSKKDSDSNVTDTSDKEKDDSAVVSVPSIGSTKRFASGRKADLISADLISEMEAHNSAEAEAKHDDLVKVNHAKQNKNNVLKKKLDMSASSAAAAAPAPAPLGTGGSMNMFKSRRKMDWNVEVKGVRVRHRSAGLA